MFITLNFCFWLNSSAFFSKKDILSESGEQYAQIKHSLKQKQF